MSSSDTVTETLDEGGTGIADRMGSLSEALGPTLARQTESGNLAAASGVVSLVRAGRTFLKGNRKRGVLQALAGLFWVGVALAQRRSGDDSSAESGRDWDTPETSDEEVADVANSSPDIEGVETEKTDTDHATGEEVVDTTNADLDEADTAPEVESDAEGDVDQRDVVDADGLEDVDSEDESEDVADADADEATQAEPDGGTEDDE